MDLEELLAPVAGEFEIADALSGWRWLVPQTVRTLVVTAMGDLFMIANDGTVLFLNTNDGTCEQAATSVADWENKLGDPEIVDQWFMPDLVVELRESKPLCQGECYSPIHSPILGGTFEAENWKPMNWSVHFAVAGALHEAIKDLPPGTRIMGINFPKL